MGSPVNFEAAGHVMLGLRGKDFVKRRDETPGLASKQGVMTHLGHHRLRIVE